MESKALETLGILRPKRTLSGIMRGIFRKTVLVVIIALCAWGGILIFNRIESVGGDDVVVSTGDDGIHIREHLAVSKVSERDTRTVEDGSRIVPTSRQYWYKLTIDKRWYYKKFVPRVKSYVDEIAPGVETSELSVDTKDLAYANDGADRLQKLDYGSYQDGDALNWSSRIGAPRGGSPANGARRSEDSVLLIDSENGDGSVTHATVYHFNRAQREKLENWIGREVLRDRVSISAVVNCGGHEIGSGTWSTGDIRPIEKIYTNRNHYYAISPWVNVNSGIRCRFLGIHCENSNGITGDVDIRWSL